MYVLYFTIFTGVESILPGTSNLGVMIIIAFRYMMQCTEGEGYEEVSPPDVRESTLYGYAVPSLM